MRDAGRLLVAAACLLAACGPARREEAGAHRAGEEAERMEEAGTAPAAGGVEDPHGPGEAAEQRLVRIAPDMLRDLRLTTARVEVRAAGDAVTALGELGVDQEAYAEVGSPLPARVVRLLASPGDRVRAGGPLAELESVELGASRARLLEAEARETVARQALERKRGLAADRVVPRRELQEAEAEAASARAALEAAQAALAALGAQARRWDPDEPGAAARFTLHSPIAGSVLQRDAARGRLVDPSRPLFRVAELSRLWLDAHVFERDAVRLRAGAEARVSFPALPGRTITGRVFLVGSQVDPGSRTVPVQVRIDNPDGVLRPGMSATVRIPLGQEEGSVVAVPTAALQRLEQSWCVFLPRGPGDFEARSVGRGRDLGGEVEILSGLTQGDTVVVEGAFLLKAEAERSRGEGEHHDH